MQPRVRIYEILKGLSAWRSAFSNPASRLREEPYAVAILEMQYLTINFAALTSRTPFEKTCDLFEQDFIQILDLAERCLHVFPSAAEAMASDCTALSSTGTGLILTTDILSYINLCGVKHRSSATRQRAQGLLYSAHRQDGVYSTAGLIAFMQRITTREEQNAFEVTESLSFVASEVPEGARSADVVLAQNLYRPTCMSMTSTRYLCAKRAEPMIEVIEDEFDYVTGADISRTTQSFSIPKTCIGSGGFSSGPDSAWTVNSVFYPQRDA